MGAKGGSENQLDEKEATVTVVVRVGVRTPGGEPEKFEAKFSLRAVDSLFRNLGQDAALGLTGGITAADFFNECETSAARPPGASCYGDEFLLDVPFPQAAAHRHRLLRLEVLAAAVATPSYSPVVNVNANLSVEGAVMLVHMWRQAKAYRGTLTAKAFCGQFADPDEEEVKASAITTALNRACNREYGVTPKNLAMDSPPREQPTRRARRVPEPPTPDPQPTQQAQPQLAQPALAAAAAAEGETMQPVLQRLYSLESRVQDLTERVRQLEPFGLSSDFDLLAN